MDHKMAPLRNSLRCLVHVILHVDPTLRIFLPLDRFVDCEPHRGSVCIARRNATQLALIILRRKQRPKAGAVRLGWQIICSAA